VIDQVTGPPCAVSLIVVPPGGTVSWPPAGSTTSVPAAGGRDGDGLARVGDGVGVRDGVEAGLAVVGTAV